MTALTPPGVSETSAGGGFIATRPAKGKERAMWEVLRAPEGGGERLTVSRNDATMTFADVLAGWRGEAGFREATLDALAAAPAAGLIWEMPPLRATTRDQPYECVLLPCPALAAARPDPSAFEAHFAREPEASIVVFPNLGRDATLVAPRPLAPDSAYGHLAAFVRDAPTAQRHALLQTVAAAVDAAMDATLGERPLWLNTNGLGVPWLHVRLDARPKYYWCRRYREAR